MELDVTHVASQLNAYNRMRNTAIDLAAAMDGVLTDDSGARLTPEALDQIGTAVNTLYTELAARDLAAGSPLARRLFS
jgi:FtsZ-interacting cell division protein ZipA